MSRHPPSTSPSHDDVSIALANALVSRLKLRQLRLLQEIREHRTVNRTAAAMGLSQPAISKALREVESTFSTQLFERTNQGLIPTAAGEAVLTYATRWLADAESAARTLTAIRAGRRSRVRLGFTHYVPQALLSAAISRMLNLDEPVAMLTREGTTDELVRAILGRELDAAIGRSFDGASPDIEQVSIYQQEPCLIVSAKSVARISRGELDWVKLAQLHWVLPPPNTPMRRTYNTIFVGAGVQPPAPIVETLSLRSVETALRVDPNAVTILPTDVAADFVAAGHGARLPYKLNWNLPPVTFLTLRQTVADPVMTMLLDALTRTARQMQQQRLSGR
ncbi:MAG: LysR family transcriptional regulator [Gammaproteobacteria bacterium]|nr:LysR family transcriptional regulator [Gammaproteobacteria bacterium]MBU1441594.1 LysR family transcriptional regulator [Gammaproteobacteria bacterium]MBU2286124.1 LysR family transcriptional regulator [Gammaproteobacteria bacterium]MBU2410429.1 LysR family transcriptional regulator [Gammaproteobacteria bacterium]